MSAVKFLSIFLVALATIPSGAHLMELANKINVPGQAYLTMQQIYRGWALSGIVIFAALLMTFLLAYQLRRSRGYASAVIAFLCLLVTQVIFWSLTFPVNAATDNWTFLPENWQALRAQWEYSHAANALVNGAALVAVIQAVLRSSQQS